MSRDRTRSYGSSNHNEAPSTSGPHIRLDVTRFGFSFDDDQLAMREAAETFARARVAPGAAERDHTREYPLELVQELAQMGLLAMKVSTSRRAIWSPTSSTLTRRPSNASATCSPSRVAS